jgi:hypothetical protein
MNTQIRYTLNPTQSEKKPRKLSSREEKTKRDCMFIIRDPCERLKSYLSHLHGLVTIDIRSTGYPPLIKLFLQLCNLLQALRLANQFLDALALLVGELYSHALFGGGAFSRGRNIERAGLDTHNLGCEG